MLAFLQRTLRAHPVLAGVAFTMLTASVLHGATAAPASVTVDISKFAFAPKDVTVPVGTRVVWTNKDDAPHTVTSHDKSFASKGMDTDDRYEHTFEREGDFAYICTVHPFMTGTVHVRKP